MKTREKILIVVDYQYDFVAKNGALPVPNADKIYKNIQEKIDSGNYDTIIYTFDTHTKREYENSDEQKIFPNIHCEFGTKGWGFYKIKPKFYEEFKYISNNFEKPFECYDVGSEIFFTKNVFDIWKGNSTYPQWFEERFNKNTEIDVCGVATNYCVFDNIQGMTKRGYKVNILTDSVEGIKEFPDGSIDESYCQNIKTMKDNGVIFD